MADEKPKEAPGAFAFAIAMGDATKTRFEDDKPLILQKAAAMGVLHEAPDKNEDYLNLLLDMVDKLEIKAAAKKGGKA